MTDGLVLAFPGQGSLATGAGAPWVDHPAFDAVRAVAEATGVDVAHLLVEADEATLVSTENAQLATFALSLCVLDATGLGDGARTALGHSLGEYTALVAAGMLARADGARLVARRGAAMRSAAEATPGGLVALLGVDRATAETVCKAVDGLAIANVNGPGQVVVGGADDVLEDLQARAKDLGVRRAVRLKVGGAFHTPLMAPARDALAPALEATSFVRGTATVLANVDGVAHGQPGDWPALLLRQLTEPVEFEACVRALPSGARVLECGPGAVLKGLIGRIRDDLDVRAVGTPDELGDVGVT